MFESAQISRERKDVRQLGGQVRLLGLAFTGVAAYGALASLPASKTAINVSAGLITIGLHMTGRMARDCFMAADYARDPVATARASLKTPPILSNLFLFVVASAGLGTLSDSLREPTPRPDADIVGYAHDQLATATNPDLGKITRLSNLDCPRGNVTITFEKNPERTTIVECAGP